MAYKKKTENAQKPELILSPQSQRPFQKINIYLMGACIALIIIGFLLMTGSGTTTESFNPDIFSTRRIIIGPTITFLGFLLMAFAIIYPGKKTDKTKQ